MSQQFLVIDIMYRLQNIIIHMCVVASTIIIQYIYKSVVKFTVFCRLESHYTMVRYNMILHTIQQL